MDFLFFSPISDYFSKHARRIVARYVSPIAHEYMKSFDLELRKAIQTLSLFRIINPGFIAELVEKGILVEETDSRELWVEIEKRAFYP